LNRTIAAHFHVATHVSRVNCAEITGNTHTLIPNKQKDISNSVKNDLSSLKYCPLEVLKIARPHSLRNVVGLRFECSSEWRRFIASGSWWLRGAKIYHSTISSLVLHYHELRRLSLLIINRRRHAGASKSLDFLNGVILYSGHVIVRGRAGRGGDKMKDMACRPAGHYANDE